jgi:hypothetical protein
MFSVTVSPGQQASADRGTSNIDYESNLVCAVDGDRQLGPVLVLIEGDAEDLDDLDPPPAGRQIEEPRLCGVQPPEFDTVPVSALLDAAFAQVPTVPPSKSSGSWSLGHALATPCMAP